MGNMLTLEEVQSRIKEKNGDRIFIEDYDGLNKPVTVYCKAGKHSWSAKAKYLIDYDTECYICKNYAEHSETVPNYIIYAYGKQYLTGIIGSFDKDEWIELLELRSVGKIVSKIDKYASENNIHKTVESMAEDYIYESIKLKLKEHRVFVKSLLATQQEELLYSYETSNKGNNIMLKLAKGRDYDESRDGESFKKMQEKVKHLIKMSDVYEKYLEMEIL